jgi:hypothetical protein
MSWVNWFSQECDLRLYVGRYIIYALLGRQYVCVYNKCVWKAKVMEAYRDTHLEDF